MIDILLRDMRQPEYIHVLINQLPLLGLTLGCIGLIVALLLRSRSAKITTLVIVFISAASAWPTYELGQKAYNPVLTMVDEHGQAWLEVHKARAEQFIWYFYALAVLTAVAIVAPIKWKKTSVPLALAVLLLSGVVLGMGAYIGYAGGKIRHREFRNEPPPSLPSPTPEPR